MIDYYAILKLAPDANAEAINEKYQFLLGTFRPLDLAGGHADQHFSRAKDEIQLLNQAYEVLHDANLRREYDRERNIAIADARKSSTALLEDLPPLQLTLSQSEPALAPARSATANARRWHESFDAGVIAAFMAGALIASGGLAVKYWHSGPQSDHSFVGRLLRTELARKEPSSAPVTAFPSVVPAPEMRSPGGRTVYKVTAPPKPPRRQLADNALEGQIGPVRRERPVNVDIILAKGQQTFGAQQIGNIEVTYPDGMQDAWTTRGNCGQAQVAADGTVGWTVYQATPSGNYDFQPNGTLVLRKRGQTVRMIAPFDYIAGWNFLKGGSEVVVRSGRSSSPTVFQRCDSATGRVLESVDASRSDLPAWASAAADR